MSVYVKSREEWNKYSNCRKTLICIFHKLEIHCLENHLFEHLSVLRPLNIHSFEGKDNNILIPSRNRKYKKSIKIERKLMDNEKNKKNNNFIEN